jgi:DNA-binding NarL/FixJ family response regulator
MPETILLLQNNAWKAAIVQELLTQSSEGPFVVEWLGSCAAGLERLNYPMKNAITAVLVDLSVPDGQGLETFDQILHASPHIPILVLSNPEHEEVAKQAVQRGAQDYVLDDRLEFAKLLGSDLSATVIA